MYSVGWLQFGVGTQLSERYLVSSISTNALLGGLGVARAGGIIGLTPQGNRFSTNFKRLWTGHSGHSLASHGPESGAVGSSYKI